MADQHQCAQQERLRLMEESLRNGRQDFREIKADIKQILQDVATLKEKARNWGALFGAATAVVVNIVFVVIKAML